MHCLVCISLLSFVSTGGHLATRLIGTNLDSFFYCKYTIYSNAFLMNGWENYDIYITFLLLLSSKSI